MMQIRKRESLEEMFSTFLNFKSQTQYLWQANRKAEQNVKTRILLNPTASERDLAEDWLNEYLESLSDQPNQTALSDDPSQTPRFHLAAYFEDSCFWIAQKIAEKRAGKSSHLYLFQEYFQIARSIVAEPKKILDGYDTSRSNSPKSVKNWGQLKLTSAILEKIGEKTYSDAGMLRRQTKTSMKKVLQEEGITLLSEGLLKRLDIKETQLARCVLAWESFQRVYTPSTPKGRRQLLWPDTEYLKKIADEYNQQAIEHKLTPSMTAQNLDELLKTCVKALRNSSENQMSDLDVQEMIYEAETRSKQNSQEMIYETEAGIEELENTEIGECLSNAFTALPKEAQIMLRLWHGLGFNQGDVGELFGIERNQIANTVKGWRKFLLQELNKYLGKPMTTQEIKQKSKKMDLWLEDYCRDDFVYFLSNTLNNELNGDVELLQKCYNKGKFDLKAGANYLKIPESEVSQRIEKLKVQLGYRLTDYVSSQLTAEVDKILHETLSTKNLAKTLTVDLVNQRLAEFLDENNQDIAKFVEEWLTKNRAGV
ncbi:hypothetical protein BCD67_21805 [Oscillatoriales cyanobacterium USR001]|nr:hypothetical protein BCD67_21805 [Oscillatoriales cyanobacterium USR001]